jgi:hypothetical protein
MEERLRELQRLLYKTITAPEGVQCGLQAAHGNLPACDARKLIVDDGRLSPIDRLTIYSDAYFYRLLECLKDDFPAVAGVIGEEKFRELIRAYLAAHPPSHTSITYAGQFLADFICSHPAMAPWPFLTDVARLERTLIEVFQAQDADTLKAADLHGIAPERWPKMRLKTPPALQVVDCRWRVAEVLRAIREEIAWEAPEPVAQSVMVWRLDGAVYYREVALAERKALSLLARGASFAAVCEAIAATCAQDEAVAEINRLLERWVSDRCLMLEHGHVPPAMSAAQRQRRRRKA